MFSLTGLFMFITASVVLILSPGPDSIYVLSRGISQGRKAGLVSAAGVTLGILVHTLFAAFGLAVVLAASAIAFTAIKLIGAAYLVYLGIKALLEKDHSLAAGNSKSLNMRGLFTQGILSNVLNPKVALFFMAFLPQFVSPDFGPVPLQMLALGLLFAAMTLLYLGVLGWFSGHVGGWLSQRQWAERWIKRLTGGVLVALGIRLAFVHSR